MHVRSNVEGLKSALYLLGLGILVNIISGDYVIKYII